MKTVMHLLFALVTIAVLAGFAATPVFAGVNQGDKEVSAAVSIDNSSTTSSGQSSSSTITTIFGSFGYFFDKHSQAGIAEQLSQTKVSSGGSTTEADLTFTQGFYKYHFIVENNPAMVPWVGGYLGFMSIKVTSGGQSASGNGNSYGPAAGVKFFVDENTSINVEYQIIKSSYSFSFGGASTTVDQTDNTLLAGLSVYFGGKK